MSQAATSPDLAPRPAADPAPIERCIASSLLLGEEGQVWIAHNGELYCLRLTRRNRLILTK